MSSSFPLSPLYLISSFQPSSQTLEVTTSPFPCPTCLRASLRRYVVTDPSSLIDHPTHPCVFIFFLPHHRFLNGANTTRTTPCHLRPMQTTLPRRPDDETSTSLNGTASSSRSTRKCCSRSSSLPTTWTLSLCSISVARLSPI